MGFWSFLKNKKEVAAIRKMLEESKTGINALNFLKKNRYSVEIQPIKPFSSDIRPEKKKILLNDSCSLEYGALKVIDAARSLKQEEKGIAKTPQTKYVRSVDSITEQLVFAEEMRQKNPKILEAFIVDGYGDRVCKAYEKAIAKTKDQNVARSAAVDYLLDALAPEKTFPAEVFNKVCTNDDGKSYYVGSKTNEAQVKVVRKYDSLPKDEAVRKTLEECNTGIETLKSLERNGYSIGIRSFGGLSSYIDEDEKKFFLDKDTSIEDGALEAVDAARTLKHKGKGVDILETKTVCLADVFTEQLVFAEEMKQKNPKILKTFKANGYGDVLYEAYEQAMDETNNPNAARSAAVDCYLDHVVPEKTFLSEAFNKICTNADGKSYYVGSKMKKSPLKAIRKLLEECNTGIETLKSLEKSGYTVELHSFEGRLSDIHSKKKRILVDQDTSPEAGALFMVEAARTLKHEAEGTDTPETKSVCNADILTAQLVFAEEMKQKNPKILETFREERYGNALYEAYEQAITTTNNPNAARSVAVDYYLDDAVSGKKFSSETFNKICTNADGKSYYVGSKTDKSLSVTKANADFAFNAALAAKAKQGR